MKYPTKYIYTNWLKFNYDTCEWEHNHRTDGKHETGLVPPVKVPGSIQEKAWKDGLWKWVHYVRNEFFKENPGVVT